MTKENSCLPFCVYLGRFNSVDIQFERKISSLEFFKKYLALRVFGFLSNRARQFSNFFDIFSVIDIYIKVLDIFFQDFSIP